MNSGMGNRILVVDDEIYSLQVCELQLQAEGFTNLLCCQGGQEALDLLDSQEVSIIILDLHMPEISGMGMRHAFLCRILGVMGELEFQPVEQGGDVAGLRQAVQRRQSDDRGSRDRADLRQGTGRNGCAHGR